MNIEDFQTRQEADYARDANADGEYVVRRRPFHERLEDMQKANRSNAYNKDEVAIETDSENSEPDQDEEESDEDDIQDAAGEEGWRTKEGERLADFGVDEVADFYDEDDLPLSELMRRRKVGNEAGA